MNEFVALNISKVSLDTSWDYENVISPFYRLYYIEEGEGLILINGKRQTLKPGMMYLIPSFTLASYSCPNFLYQNYLHFEEVITSGISLKLSFNLEFEVVADSLDKELWKRLLELNPEMSLLNANPRQPESISLSTARPLLFSKDFETRGIILQLLAKFVQKVGQNTKPNKTGSHKILKVLEHIHQHYSQELSVVKLAGLVSLNEDYFSRIFLRIIGVRPVVYINQVRIEKAQHLLLFTDQSLEQVAENVGYGNRTYFSKMFKSITGKTIGQYRRQAIIV
ncbi:MAG: AraC-like DNA-binding protein [Arcticibacterium sp.]|jgi:AraC-like DNA-binding protein